MTYGTPVCDMLVVIGVIDDHRSTKTRLARTAWNGGGIQVPFLVIGVMNYDPAMPVVYMALLDNRLGWGRDTNTFSLSH